MSGEENETRPVDFVEQDAHETPLPYGEGRLPWFVVLVWAVILGGLGVYSVLYWIPDFRRWW
jgi:hypothetical protein